ncbi:cysteine hydrolase [Streptomyces sp. LP11]|uniref:Cysteine hydrolase n=1 Tax=Streptomyces pyxinicus TaxID=2970331 RepID=A0ABT2BBB2_9ACTN|nr:isochorismatase family cysteine hydrolase [Streptomyces sp. LP11]MCS0605813.1 cysteine hydrolase [Streptomyces sp. LP11]
MTGPTDTALVLVDLQNDFCAGPVARARFGGDPAVLDAVVAASVRAAETARARGVEVVFVRFLGDPEHQGAGWRLRDQRLGKRPKCLEGSWGAEFHGPLPEPGEAVFTKRACFDAFLGAGFEEHLRARGARHLVFAGLYADVCVDSTARTAFQKGFHVTVLSDCTTALHLPDDAVLRFMRAVYGARTVTADDPTAWTVPALVPEPKEEACVPPPV